ncbi:WXG100 family type VII secretion target [Mycobacterium sp.]|uniref:WXG100 family type VII secretion target n=1 Tax=Mycobacterium sp. TaxID=1785 RepID=UPI0031D1ACF4
MSEHITYNYGAVTGFASDVASRAAQLMEIHDDIAQRTRALTDFFQGSGATAFFDAQQQMLHGLDGLIQTISQHGHVVNNTAESAQATDLAISQAFL